ncbi:Mitochondrial thiamine diphosphate carrier 1 [Bienertia sinuspersici]
MPLQVLCGGQVMDLANVYFGVKIVWYVHKGLASFCSLIIYRRLYMKCSLLRYGTDHEEAPSLGKIVSVQAAGGVVAGATASCITTPLDTIKTRLQVQLNFLGIVLWNIACKYGEKGGMEKDGVRGREW